MEEDEDAMAEYGLSKSSPIIRLITYGVNLHSNLHNVI